MLFRALQDASNLNIRKLAAKLLCMLAYDNEESQTYICQHCGFNQLSDKICINSFPDYLKAQIKENPELIKDIKSIKYTGKGSLYWTYPAYNPSDVNDFPDPLFHLVGFYVHKPDKSIRRNTSKFNKSFQLKASIRPTRTSTISPSPKCSIEVRPLSIPKRISMIQDWSKTSHISCSVIENIRDSKTCSRECLESVIEEESIGNIESKKKIKEYGEKYKRTIISENKKSLCHKTTFSQHIETKINTKKFENVMLSIAQTSTSSRFNMEKLNERNQKMCMTLRPN